MGANRILTMAAVLVAFAMAPVAAQQSPLATEPGTVIGVVRDPSGGLMPGAEVRLSGPAAPQPLTAVTNVNGSYQIARVPAGTYTLSVRMAGFFPFLQSDIVVRPGATVQTHVTVACCPPSPGGLRAEPPATTMRPVLVRIATSEGAIDVEIDTPHAPITAANFLKYVDSGMYNGGRFYRVTREGNYTPTPPNRPLMEIIQGGIDPARRADVGRPIPLERTTATGLHHVAGVISMARGTAADTATSEFFILLDDQPSLDMGGKRFDDEQGAAAFGKVVAGMDVVRKINQLPTNGDRLLTPIVIESITRLK